MPVESSSPVTFGTEPLRAARETLRTERKRTVDELDALDAFAEAVRAIETTGPDAMSAGGLRVRSSTSALDAVREAYENTVMAVPHYDEEYDESFAEHVAGEFGPDVAAALTQGPQLDDHCKRLVVAKAEAARNDRARFLETLQTERESLVASRDRILAVLDRLPADRDDYASESFGALDAHRSQLQRLATRCDDIAADRQATLRRQSRELWLPSNAPQVPEYLYQDLAVSYPVLSVVATLGDVVNERRRRVERAMTGGE